MEEGDFIAVSGDLKPGELVVLTGKDTLKDDSKVRFSSAEPVAAN